MERDASDGEIVEVDPPRRFVQTWRILMDPLLAAEPVATSAPLAG
jgi:hypothetical protein